MAKGFLMKSFFKRPWIIVAVLGAITLFFALQLPKAQLDNNNFNFIPKDDPARVASHHIDETFGSQVVILVGLERKHGTILEADFLNKLRDYGKKVEALGAVDTVTSIANADYIGGSADTISVSSLIPESFSGSAAEIAQVKDRLLEWDMYRRALVSDDFTSTQVVVAMSVSSDNAGSPESVEAYRRVKKLAESEGFEDTKVFITGMSVFSGEVNAAMGADLIFLIPLVVIAVLFVLFLSFRKLSGIILPILTVAISATWAIGAMTLLGFKLSIITTVLPVILVAVGSAYCIHVISHYYDEIAGKRNLSREDHAELIYLVIRKYGKPVFLAAFTDATGFAALCFTPVVPISVFGIFSTFGILVAFVVAITLIPSILLIRGPSKTSRGEAIAEGTHKEGINDPLSVAIADAFGAAARKRRSMIALSLAVVALSIVGVSRLVIDNVLVEYFRPGSEVVKADKFIRDYFGGSKEISVVLRGEKPGDVLRPDVLAAMDGLSEYLADNVPEVGKTMGFTDLVKRVNQVFNSDESPDGIAARAEAPQASAETAVDDSSFGFGFGAAPAAPAAPAAKKAAPKKAASEEKLDRVGVVKLLSDSLASKGRRDMSAGELVASLAKSVNYRGASYYEIPVDPERYGKKDSEGLRALVGNYLALLSGNISAYADDPLEPKAIRLAVQLRTVGQLDTNRAINAIRDYAAARFPKDVKVEIGGTALVEESLNKLVVKSQLSSMPLSLLLVFLTLTLFYRSGFAGLVGITPLAISILINFGVMGAFGIKLNIGTAMVASIAIGIGIDYTIHYMAAYHREYMASGGKGDYMRRTFLTSGKAIIFNAASVGLGFAVLALSRFTILAQLGLLMALTMFTSALVSLTILPVLLETFKPAFIRRPLPSEKAQTKPEVVI
jgi:predicted RND superfamily exporter protein